MTVEAVPAPPRTPPNFAVLWLWALGLTVIQGFGLTLLILTVTFGALVWVVFLIPFFFASLYGLRAFANLHRWWDTQVMGVETPRPYRPLTGSILNRMRTIVTDPATWRDLGWALANETAGFALRLLVIVAGLLFGWAVNRPVMELYARMNHALLAPTGHAALRSRVQELTTSRAETVDAHAAELRRVERDLHDGAQARLVALGMSLGLAEEMVESDPDMVRQLLIEAREASGQALSELRDVVRGIYPPVLADRGLAGAVQAVALGCSVPTDVEIDLPGRPSAPVESAAYFAVSEALTNVMKHSGARKAWVRLGYSDGELHILVGDDGRGGATASGGSGLPGLERRLGAFDGTLFVNSPVGGPTVVVMDVPCELTGVSA